MIHLIDNWRTYDDRGVMMPWYSRPCLEWLDTFITEDMIVFEYGCGASSLWYQSRTRHLLGVESDMKWVFTSGQFHTTEKDLYISFPQRCSPKPFNLIIIDGDFRDDCTEHALKHLKKGGYLICDNFEQASADLAHWPKTRELTKNMPITIYKEPGHPDWQTAVFQNV